ncbi:MAG: S1C family serine protease [Caulobacteraceae bacterium]
MDNFDNGTEDRREGDSQESGEIQQAEPGYESLEQKAEDIVNEPADNRKYEQVHYKRPSGLSYLATGLVGAVIGGILVSAIVPSILYNRLAPMYQGNNQLFGQQVVLRPSDNLNVAAAVAQKVTPAVVRISTITIERDMFFGKKSYEGEGSGVIIDPRGYILTNAHVVGEHPEELTVFFKDGRELTGNVLWKDTLLDLAVVKVDAANLAVAEMGDSDNLIVGETTIAIGNPLGTRFERTVTQGIVSGLNRSIMVEEEGSVMEDLIQTDAAINPGNSGGPLINGRGEVIGINTIKASAEGLGFAIPINMAKPITKKLIENGKFIPTYMGITPLDSEMLGYYATDIQIQGGIYLYDVKANTPAKLSGLKKGDIITHINNTEVNTLVKFKYIVFSRNPGDTVKVTYLRNGREYTTDVKLVEMPEEFR